MIAKVSRPIVFLYTSVSSFLILVLTLYSYFYAANKKKWLLELLEAKIFHLPLLVYVVIISIMVGFITVLLVYLIRRLQYGKIEEKLRLLARGNYDSYLLVQALRTDDNEYIRDIDRAIGQIREKLIGMSKELQEFNSQPQLVDGQLKEEILENERHRLARELHDSVSQQLFAAMMMLSALNETVEKLDIPESFHKQLKTVGNIVNASQSEMRALLLHLRPINLEGKSLKKGIEQLLVELQTKIQIGLTWEVADVHLQSGMEDHLFRIAQELLSNTLRHAKAKELEVYLKQVDQNVLLRMIDDGVGFDMSDQKVGSYGLNNIRERVAGMGGLCKIVSFKGKGTSVEIKVPVIRSEEQNDKSIAGG